MLFCSDVELMLQDYLDGYLLPSQSEVLEIHVRECDSCRKLLMGITRIDNRLGDFGQVEAPAHLSRAILAALPAQAYSSSRLRRAISYGVVPVLGAFLIAFGIILKGRYLLKNVADERDIEVYFSAPQAVSVAVVGDFNGWNPRRTNMVRSSHKGLWRAQLKLHPGIYQYSFVIDGTTWIRDPQAKGYLADGFGGENSVMVVDG